jgi:hypothetical protein
MGWDGCQGAWISAYSPNRLRHPRRATLLLVKPPRSGFEEVPKAILRHKHPTLIRRLTPQLPLQTHLLPPPPLGGGQSTFSSG